MRVIINADDLGMSMAVNDAIFELMAAGRITSATVMANGLALENAALRAKLFPNCSFGVHLNVSQFRPLTMASDLRPILNEDGCFSENKLRNLFITRSLKAALFEELKTQVKRLYEAGFEISHFDSHHHLHTIPGIFTVLKQLQRTFGIRKVRLSWNIYLPAMSVPFTWRLAKRMWNFALRNYFSTITTDVFASLEVFSKASMRLKKSVRTAEVMVHPGGKKFEPETRFLTGEWWRELPFPIEQISYHDL